jgi:hypothetical protein
MPLTSRGTLKFPSGFSIPVEVPSADVRTVNKSTREIRAVLVLERTLNTKETKIAKNWHQKAVASRTKQTASVNQPKVCKRRVETLPAESPKTTANVAIKEFVKRSQASYRTAARPTNLKAVQPKAKPKLERVTAVTFTRNTPAGRGSTKELKDSRGNTYPDAATAAAAYGVSRWLIYWVISKRNGRLSKDLVIGYTGRLIPRWLYHSRASGKTYASILLASKGEAVSSGKIFSNLKQPEEQLEWEVLAPSQ